MSWPLEGSRDVDDGIIVSMVPDVCMTPQGFIDLPVPYTVWCRQADAANLANSVRQTDDRSHALASIVLKCYGDEPGTGGGVDSGTTGAECTPKTWSQSLRAEGRNMVRHTDEWWMNHRNTYGRLIYTKDMNLYETPAPDQITPQMRPTTSKDTTEVASQPQTSQLMHASYQVPPTPPGMEKPRGRPILGPTGMEQADDTIPIPGAVGKILKGARVAAKFLDNCCIASYYDNGGVVYVDGKPIGGRGGCRLCGNAKGMEDPIAHHGIVDNSIRSGGVSDQSSMRAPGVPSYWEALTICIPKSDHNALHKKFKAEMADSANKDTGLSTWANTKKNSFEGIDNLPDSVLSKRCKEIYKGKLESSYRLNDDTPTRAFENNPPDSNPKGQQYQQLMKNWGGR